MTTPLILGIESSCDETAVALLRGDSEILAHCVASQVRCHAPYGGVVPELAARDHLRQLPSLLGELNAQLLAKDPAVHPAALWSQLTGIAVTQGPGLFGSLLMGMQFASGLAWSLQLPLIMVDHVLAHFHGVFVDMHSRGQAPTFPALGYVISGGHTHLFYLHHPVKMDLVAHTIDDACGECFDKVGGMLGLNYPAGAEIERRARHGDPRRYPMPHVMGDNRVWNVSYSGLKTHIYHLIRRLKHEHQLPVDEPLPAATIADIAASFQQAAFDQLVRKLTTVAGHYPQAKTIYLAGGVACNQALRQLIMAWAAAHERQCHAPPPALCTDNAVMIASMGYHLSQRGAFQASAGLSATPYNRFRQDIS